MIRSINKVIHTLLFQSHLPPTFWVEALHMAAHLINITPSSSINNGIPFSKLYNKPPSFLHLRVFGCLCYPHLHTPHKLAPRSRPCIFLGYPNQHRGFRCFDLETRKIIISRHVVFQENVFPYKAMTPNKAPSYSFLDEQCDINPTSRAFRLSEFPTTTTTETGNESGSHIFANDNH